MKSQGNHDHTRLLSKIRRRDRFNRKPKAKTDRFRYCRITVGGVEAMTIFLDDEPLFKQPIRCRRDQALSLVRRLNESQQVPAIWPDIVERWLKTVMHEQ